MRKLGENKESISCPSLAEIHQSLLAEARRLANEESVHFRGLVIKPAHLLNALALEFMRQTQAVRAERARALVRELERLADGPPKPLGSYRPEEPSTGNPGSVKPRLGRRNGQDKPTGNLEMGSGSEDEPAIIVRPRPARFER